MDESTGYAVMTNKAFPPIKGKIKRRGIPFSVRRRMDFLKTHNIIVTEDIKTGEPITIISDRQSKY